MGLGNDPILMGGHVVPRDKYTQNNEGKISFTAPTINVSNKDQAPVEPVVPPQSADFSAMPQSSDSMMGYNPTTETLRSGVGQGLMMGFGDELEAALRSGQISGHEYIQIRNELRKKHELFKTEHPAINLTSELAGGILFPYGKAVKGAEMLGIGGGLDAALKSKNLGERMIGGTKLGGVTGAVVGAGTANELSDVPFDTVKGGLVGGLVGGVVVPAAISLAKTGFNVASSTFKNLTERMGLGNANKTANKIIAKKLSQDELTPADVDAMFAEYRTMGVSDAVLADLGVNLRNLGYTAQSVAGKGKKQVEDFLTERTANIPSNIVNGLVKKAKVASEEFGFNYKQSLADQQKALANKAYPNAYSQDLPTAPFKSYLNRKDFVKAYQEAIDSAERKGEPPLPPLASWANAETIPTELLHRIKRGLDIVIEGEKDHLGRFTTKGKDLIQVKNEFNSKIKDLNPDYAAANEKFADEAKIQSAFDLGSSYHQMDADELLSKVAKFSVAEKESFRIGLLSYAKRQLSEHKGGNFINKIFSSDKQKAAMRNVFDTPEDYQNFVKQLKLSSEQIKTGQKVLGGSPTAERQLLQQEDTRLIEEIATNPSILGVIKALTRSAGGNLQISPRTADALKQRLFNSNPQEQQLIIAELNKFNNPSLVKSIINAPYKIPAVTGSFGLLD